MNIVREIVKLLMFTVLWSIPLATDVLTGKSSYWLYAVSVVGSFIMFSHYESLKNKKEVSDEKTEGSAERRPTD